MATATEIKKKKTVRMNGCVASAQAAKYADVDVITAYPIRPYTATMMGASLVLPGPKLDAESVLDLLAEEKVTLTAGVPTVWMAMLKAIEDEPERWDLSSVRRLLVGGSAVPKSMIEGYQRLGLFIVQGWGMTETSPLASTAIVPPEMDDAPDEEKFEYRARQGTPAPFVDIRARLGPPNLLAVPIGAYEPRWLMSPQHVNPEESVRIFQDLGAKYALGVHWGTFQLTDESLDEPPRALAAARARAGIPDDRFFVMAVGETRHLAPLLSGTK